MSIIDVENALLDGRLVAVFGHGECNITEVSEVPKGTGQNAQMPVRAGARPRARAELAVLLSSPSGRDLIESLLHTAHEKGMARATNQIMSERQVGGISTG